MDTPKFFEDLREAGFTVVTDLGWPPRPRACCSASCCKEHRATVERLQAKNAFFRNLLMTRMPADALTREEIDQIV